MEDFFEFIPLLIAGFKQQDPITTLSDIAALKGLVAKIKANGPAALAALDLPTLRADMDAAKRTITLADALLADQTHGPQALTLMKKVLSA